MYMQLHIHTIQLINCIGTACTACIIWNIKHFKNVPEIFPSALS